jgi:hypothetical protein
MLYEIGIRLAKNYACWNEWRGYFEVKGYNTIAPRWLHKNASHGSTMFM